jgi:hypothetical protein
MKLKSFIDFLRYGDEKYNGSIVVCTKDGTEIPSDFIDFAMKKEVIKAEWTNNQFWEIYADVNIADISEEDTKFYWPVVQAAEGYSTGFVKLTKKEAEIVAFATDCNNWTCLELGSYCGCFSIDLDTPITCEDFENGKR